MKKKTGETDLAYETSKYSGKRMTMTRIRTAAQAGIIQLIQAGK
jgi:hypothetical protein